MPEENIDPKAQKLVEEFEKAQSSINTENEEIKNLTAELEKLEKDEKWVELQEQKQAEEEKKREIQVFKKEIPWRAKSRTPEQKEELERLESELKDVSLDRDTQREYDLLKRKISKLERELKSHQREQKYFQGMAIRAQGRLKEKYDIEVSLQEEPVREPAPAPASVEPARAREEERELEDLVREAETPPEGPIARAEAKSAERQHRDMPSPSRRPEEREELPRGYQLLTSGKPQIFSTEGNFVYDFLRKYIKQEEEKKRTIQEGEGLTPSGAAPSGHASGEAKVDISEDFITSTMESLLAPEKLRDANNLINQSIEEQLSAGVLQDIQAKPVGPAVTEYELEDGEKITEIEKKDGFLDFQPSNGASGTIRVQRKGPDGKLLPDSVDIIVYDKGEIVAIIPGADGSTRVADLGGKMRSAKEHGAEHGVSVLVPQKEGDGIKVMVAAAPYEPRPAVVNPQTSLAGITAVVELKQDITPRTPTVTPVTNSSRGRSNSI